MDHFQFSDVKLLQLKSADQPSFAFDKSYLTITATRDGTTIIIKAPMKSTKELKSGVTDLTFAPKLNQKENVNIGKNPRKNYNFSGVLRGEKHPHSRLTEYQVRQIKERFASSIYMKQFNSRIAASVEIAKEYGVSVSCISSIQAERNWRHVQVA
jgi:hypothetical protein